MMDLQNKTAVVTGGGGLLGLQHAAALAECGAHVVLLDVDEARLSNNEQQLVADFPSQVCTFACDITQEKSLVDVQEQLNGRGVSIDILVNNAARNPKVESTDGLQNSRLENFPIEQWRLDIDVGITGAMLCSRVFGGAMAEKGSGVILNIASDLAVIAPDQRLYRVKGLSEEQQPVKPVSYSVVKTALIGLTRYCATYWADRGVRVNALSPGGVFNAQPDEFVRRLTQLIPMGRMARVDEYKQAVVFLCSDASSYMTGQNLVIDGGRSCW